MTEDERHPPDSFRGKLEGLLSGDENEAVDDGTTETAADAGTHVRTDADDPPETYPKRPTDPPF